MEDITEGDIILLERKEENTYYNRIKWYAKSFFYNMEFCDCAFVIEKNDKKIVLECYNESEDEYNEIVTPVLKETPLIDYLSQKNLYYNIYTRKLVNGSITRKFNKIYNNVGNYDFLFYNNMNAQLIRNIWSELNFIASNVNKYTLIPNDLSSQEKVIKFNKGCTYSDNKLICCDFKIPKSDENYDWKKLHDELI